MPTRGDHKLQGSPLTVATTRRYESGPPATSNLADSEDPDTYAVTKQEEWVTKRKTEYTTTKQIETRVQRQVLLEDGQVIEDSGPLVTTNTTQDTETQEHEHTEHKTSGDDPQPREGWSAVPGAVVVREKNEKKTTTRDETEERFETQEAHHLGDLTSDDLVKAIREKSDVRLSLIQRRNSATGQELDHVVGFKGQELLPLSTKKVVHQSKKHHRTVDEEDIQEHSEEKDGKIITETTRHSHHEEFDDEEFPDEEQHSRPSSVHEISKETKRNYSHIKDEDQVEYLAVPPGGRLSEGVKIGEGMHLTSETIQHEQDGEDREWESLSDRIRKTRKLLASKGLKTTPRTERESSLERKDVLTQKPLNLEAEEATRKQETSRWLESHFGSESSRSSFDPELDDQQAVSGGGISVTMKSRSSREETPQTSDSFVNSPSSVPPPPPPEPDYKIYAAPRALYKDSVAKQAPEPAAPPTKMHTGRYAGYNDRVQVLPMGPGHTFNLRTTSPIATPPMSPTVKTSFANNNNNTHGKWQGTAETQTESPVGAKPWQQKLTQQTGNDLYSVPVRRSTSFNNTSKPTLSPWVGKREEELIIEPKSENIYYKDEGPRKSISSSFREQHNQRHQNSYVSQSNESTRREDLNVTESPGKREWPPRQPLHEGKDENVPTPTSRGRTVIKVGPREYSPERKGTKLQSSQSFRVNEAFNPRFREERRGSVNTYETNFHNRSHEYEPNSLPEFRSNERNRDQSYSSGYYRTEMENTKTSPTKVYRFETEKHGNTKYPTQTFTVKSPDELIPEREITRTQKTTHKIIEEISPTLQSRKPAKAPAPPRPSPPNINGYSTTTREIFATESPPVRPERRKTKNKSDSGTQTLTRPTEMTTQTLDRTKPKKKYYLGEDPFRDNVPVNPFKDPNDDAELIDTTRRQNGVYVSRHDNFTSATMGRRGSADILSESHQPANKRYQGLDEGLRSQTLPRKPKTREADESTRNTIVNERRNSKDEPRVKEVQVTSVSSSRNQSESKNPSIAPSLARSQSFYQPNQAQSTLSKANVSFSAKTSEDKYNSPLYKSTSFLNRVSAANSTSPLRSPGIISSISKSQLDLSKSQNELREDSSLYTLPRNRGILRNSSNHTSFNANSTNGTLNSPSNTSLFRSHSTVQSRIRPTFATTKVVDTTDSSPRPTPTFRPLSKLNKEISQSEISLNRISHQRDTSNRFSTIKKSQPSLNEEIVDDHAESRLTLEQRKAKLISSLPNGKIYDSPLPRVIAGQVKKTAPEPPPKPKSPTRRTERRVSPPAQDDESKDTDKRQRFLNGLLNTAPELFMHIHGEEDLTQFKNRTQDVVDGKDKRTPSPQTPPPPLEKAPSPYGESSKYSRVSPITTNSKFSRVYTSTPVLNRLPETRQPTLKTYETPQSSFRVDRENRLNQSQSFRSQLQNNNKFFNHADSSLNSTHREATNHSLSSQPSTLRRSSLTPSSSFRSGKDATALVHRPKPENYSESFRIRSKGDPSMGNDSETDTIRTYSKRTVPLKDGFSTETIESSEKKTVTRSHYKDTEQSSPRDASLRYMDIKPQQSGGVIIEVRDWNGH